MTIAPGPKRSPAIEDPPTQPNPLRADHQTDPPITPGTSRKRSHGPPMAAISGKSPPDPPKDSIHQAKRPSLANQRPRTTRPEQQTGRPRPNAIGPTERKITKPVAETAASIPPRLLPALSEAFPGHDCRYSRGAERALANAESTPGARGSLLIGTSGEKPRRDYGSIHGWQGIRVRVGVPVGMRIDQGVHTGVPGGQGVIFRAERQRLRRANYSDLAAGSGRRPAGDEPGSGRWGRGSAAGSSAAGRAPGLIDVGGWVFAL